MINFIIPNKKNSYKPYLLRNGALLVYTAFLLFVNTFGGLVGIHDVYASSITPANIVSLSNIERGKYDLRKLKNNSKLSSAALAKANDMFKKQYWNHFGPNGETPWQFIKASGYAYVYAGENLAKGFKSSEGVVEAWMASPTHRANLLSGNYTDIGVAVVSGKLLGENTVLVVQMFGNTSNTVQPSPKVTNTKPQTEKGETMSIQITSPKNNSILNDANIDIEGNVKNVSDKYSVKIYDNNSVQGGFESNGKSWTWDKKSDWSEGEHTVKAELLDVKGESSSTKFTIDTTAPKLTKIDVVVGGFEWTISGTVDDLNSSMNFVSGNMNKSIEINNLGQFNFVINDNDIGEKTELLLVDTLGNQRNEDISDYFVRENGSVLSTFTNLINSVSNKDVINSAFLVFILILFIIEVVTYAKKHLLHKHGGSLLTLGFWWFILFIGVINGFGGKLI